MLRVALASLLALVAAMGPLAGCAHAGVFADLRVHGQADKHVEITHLGQVVAMDLYVGVTGTNTDYTDDALWGFKASFESTNVGRGNVLGTLWAGAMAPFRNNGSQDSRNGLAHQQDLDGDGDLDVGSHTRDGLFAARAGFMVPNWGDGPAEYHVVSLTFTVTDFLSPEPGDVTEINAFRPLGKEGYELAIGGMWMEDGVAKLSSLSEGIDAGTVTVGDPISLFLDSALAATLPPLPPEPPPPEPTPPAPQPPAPEPPEPEPPAPEPPTPEPPGEPPAPQPQPEPPAPEPPQPEPPTPPAPEPPALEPPEPEPPAPEPPTPEPPGEPPAPQPQPEPPAPEPPAPEPPTPEPAGEPPAPQPQPEPPAPEPPAPEPPQPEPPTPEPQPPAPEPPAPESEPPAEPPESGEPGADSVSPPDEPTAPPLPDLNLPTWVAVIAPDRWWIEVVDGKKYLAMRLEDVPTRSAFAEDQALGPLLEVPSLVFHNGTIGLYGTTAMHFPEPATLALLGAGAVAVLASRRRRIGPTPARRAPAA